MYRPSRPFRLPSFLNFWSSRTSLCELCSLSTIWVTTKYTPNQNQQQIVCVSVCACAFFLLPATISFPLGYERKFLCVFFFICIILLLASDRTIRICPIFFLFYFQQFFLIKCCTTLAAQISRIEWMAIWQQLFSVYTIRAIKWMLQLCRNQNTHTNWIQAQSIASDSFSKLTTKTTLSTITQINRILFFFLLLIYKKMSHTG